MIAILPHAAGAKVAVRAQPNARKDVVVGEHNGALKVAVSAPPEDGRANAAILEVLKAWLGVKRSQLELLSGASNRNKVFLVRDVSAEHLASVIAAKLAPPPPEV